MQKIFFNPFAAFQRPNANIEILSHKIHIYCRYIAQARKDALSRSRNTAAGTDETLTTLLDFCSEWLKHSSQQEIQKILDQIQSYNSIHPGKEGAMSLMFVASGLSVFI